MKQFLIVAALLFAAAPAAQAQSIVSYELQIYNPGVNPITGAPVVTNTIPATSVICNQPTVTAPPATVYNPRNLAWDDSANLGRSCVVDQSTVLLALPIVPGNYAGTVTSTDDRGLTSARSAASNPFGRANPPAVRTGVVVGR